ncbi:MAG: ATP-binding cassette domain-containing protein, partial [Beijerinckiaceae bacterium]
MSDILTLHDIHYAVNGAALINGVTASFAKGQCTMVLGPNGAGKSLLMKMAHGLLMPSRGSRTWPGQNMTPRHAMV